MQGWSFDARTINPENAFGGGAFPEGWYKVRISKSNIKPTNSDPQNSGKLELQCEVIEGGMQGRVYYWNLNVFNKNPQAVEIAYKQLAALCAVTGQYQVSAQQGVDTAVPMLHNIPFYLQLVVVPGQTGPINNVKGIRDINGNEPGKTGSGPPMQQPAPPNVGPAGGPSWGSPGAPQAPSQMSAPGGWSPGPAAPAAGAPAGGGWSTGPAPGPAPAGGPGGQRGAAYRPGRPRPLPDPAARHGAAALRKASHSPRPVNRNGEHRPRNPARPLALRNGAGHRNRKPVSRNSNGNPDPGNRLAARPLARPHGGLANKPVR
jgi:hypothetical protein